jgi:hypothetical protein
MAYTLIGKVLNFCKIVRQQKFCSTKQLKFFSFPNSFNCKGMKEQTEKDQGSSITIEKIVNLIILAPGFCTPIIIILKPGTLGDRQ